MTLDNRHSLASHFDCVVMLTLSNWKTEPRSNRFHYATRFAQLIPVIFVQADLDKAEARFEKTEFENLNILHVYSQFGPEQNSLMNQALLERGFIKPLLWIYYHHFAGFVAHRHSPLKVYHATEDWFSPDYGLGEEVLKLLRQVLTQTDLLVAVSDEVLRSYSHNAKYKKETILLENGCDYKFWAPAPNEIRNITSQKGGKRIALYQGGINRRLDCGLLQEVSKILDDWEIWLCGALHPDFAKQLKALLRCSNIKHLGYLSPERLRETVYRVTVGIIPFLQNHMIKVSLPLKAFEYVACGLPVVSVPIAALEAYEGIFEFADGPQQFAEAIQKVAPTRYDLSAIENRLSVARKQDYDLRFNTLIEKIDSELKKKEPGSHPLNILVLYDEQSIHVISILEHLQSFSLFSRSKVYYAHATNGAACIIDLSRFDVVVIHYSIRLCYDWHFSPSFAQAVRSFGGYKVLFIQDEYDTPETTRRWIGSLGIHAVFTCVPDEFVDQVYPPSRFPHLKRVRVLAGYVPVAIEGHEIKPIAQRKFLIGYRGRALPYHYGNLAREKLTIGLDMKKICEERGIPVDIEWADEKRIYGDQWYAFVANAKATLGTESGSNVFDDYGDIKANVERALKDNPSLSYEEIHAKCIGSREGQIKMNQVSARIFEAVALRTAMVLFEGTYSGVIQPDIHFIPLKKDFSNVDDVLVKLQDDVYLENLTRRAYEDVIGSGKYNYKQLICDFDDFLAEQVTKSSYGSLVLNLNSLYGPQQQGEYLQTIELQAIKPQGIERKIIKFQTIEQQGIKLQPMQEYQTFKAFVANALLPYPLIHKIVRSIVAGMKRIGQTIKIKCN